MKNLAKTLIGKPNQFYHQARRPKPGESPRAERKRRKTDFAGKSNQPKPGQPDPNHRPRMKPDKKRRALAQNLAGKPRQKAEKARKRTAGATAGKTTPPKRTLPGQKRRAFDLCGRDFAKPAAKRWIFKERKNQLLHLPNGRRYWQVRDLADKTTRR